MSENKKGNLTEKQEQYMGMYQSYKSYKTPIMSVWRKIRSFYNGEFWDRLKEKIKNYTLTPDTNYIEVVVTAYVNSIYTGLYVPEAKALDLNLEDVISSINSFLESRWLEMGMKKRFMVWGENTVLYNMQPAKVFLEEKIDSKNKDLKEKPKIIKKVKIEDIDPFNIFLDPSVNDFQEGQAVFIVKDVNIYSLLQDSRFKEQAQIYYEKNKNNLFSNQTHETSNYNNFNVTGNKTVSLIEYYVKSEDGMVNGFIINGDHALYETIIEPNCFPIEILYFRKPNTDPYGKGIIQKILNSYIALNLLDSMDATQPYLEQNRPRFFDLNSRINARSFIDYGNTPGAVFPVLKEPKNAVYYQDMKMNISTDGIKKVIKEGLQEVTGIDPAYKGRQTNSIITTGGIQQQQARVVMLTDNGPLVSLEDFVERIARLYIKMHISHIDSLPLNSVKINKTGENHYLTEQAHISFKDLDDQKFAFIMESIPYLPMTKQTKYEAMLQLYQVQGQYKFQIPLITEDDLLTELPLTAVQKSKMRQRISSEKQATASAKRRETLMTFAAIFQDLKNTGQFSDEEAANEALSTMDQEEMLKQQDPSLGQNPQGMNPQGGTPQMF